MKDVFAGLARLIRRRPRTTAAIASGLAIAGFAGGWVSAAYLKPSEVQYTAARMGEAPKRVVPPAPPGLQAELNELAEAFGEPVGIAVTDITDGWTAQVAGQEKFPQQSVSKLWVALAVLQAVDEGKLSLDQQVIMGPSDRSVFYQPLAERIKGDGFPITMAELLRHALVESDNSANDKLIRQLGGPDAVTRVIADKGLKGVAIGAYERDLQAKTAGLVWQPEYGLGWTFKAARAKLPDETRTTALAAYLADPPDGATPVGIVTALGALKRGELLSHASTDFMIELMGEAVTGPRRLKGGLPKGWMIAHKTGTGPDWKTGSVGINDVGLITAPDGRAYAVAVLMRQTMHTVPRRLEFMQSVTRAVAAHWQEGQALPAEGQQVAGG